MMNKLKENVVLAAHQISKKYDIKKTDNAGNDPVFWALQDISFELHKGEILGIIGTNGAGKSTILKILSEIISPTSGHVSYSGSILSILDIGTGFHPDLSGYENIFLNASLLGMKKKQISSKVEEIIAFSGIAAHIHKAVKTYSNGMYLRLALSIALFTDNEIILLDEVISVGDAEFRLKAIQKIKEQSHMGKACIMISHDLGSVLELCDTCLLLDKGKIIYSGNSKATVEEYYGRLYTKLLANERAEPKHPKCTISGVTPDKPVFFMDEPVTLKINFELKEKEDVRLVIVVKSFYGNAMTDSLTFRPDYKINYLEPGYYVTRCTIPANLFNAGSYMIKLIVGSEFELFFELELAARFKIALHEWEVGKNWNTTADATPFRPLCQWETNAVN